MADDGAFVDVVLVHRDTQARAARNAHETVLVGEHAAVADVVEQVVVLVVVNAQALLLDERVVADRVQLQVRRQRDPPAYSGRVSASGNLLATSVSPIVPVFVRNTLPRLPSFPKF